MQSETLKRTIVPAFIAAGVCLFFQRSGIFSLLFLVPLGVVAYRYNFRAGWTAFLFAFAGNVVLAVEIAVVRKIPAAAIIWDLLYFSVMASIFTWITSPPPGFSWKVSGSMRLMIGSCLGALLFTGIFFRAASSPGFSAYLNSLINAVLSFYRSSGSDVVQNALLQSITAEAVLDFMKSIMLRGGSLISCVFLFFISRQISFFLARMFQRRKDPDTPGANTPGLSSLGFFHVAPSMIWVFSGSLLLVVLVRMVKLEVPEIILWNVLIFCVIMYFAQGLGILQFFLVRPRVTPFLKLLFVILFIILLFSPGINAVLLGGIVLLGIAENWVPLRVPKTNGPPSTPEAGDGEDGKM
ncbi:MAG: YybS family protein [Treponema sp.]|nr:YybS family protein [Treponema sp.]